MRRALAARERVAEHEPATSVRHRPGHPRIIREQARANAMIGVHARAAEQPDREVVAQVQAAHRTHPGHRRKESGCVTMQAELYPLEAMSRHQREPDSTSSFAACNAQSPIKLVSATATGAPGGVAPTAGLGTLVVSAANSGIN